MKWYIKNIYKKALDRFEFQVQDYNNLDLFYKIQNLNKWKNLSSSPIPL